MAKREQPTEIDFPGSSRLEHGWYYPAARELVLQFPDGHRERYHGVTAQLFDGLATANSAGRYLREELDALVHGPA